MLSVTLVVSFTFLVLVLLLTIAMLGGHFNSLKIKKTHTASASRQSLSG